MTIALLDKAIEQSGGLPDKMPADLILGLRACRPDMRSRNGFRWPFPGKWAKAAGPFIKGNTSACPSQDGDGLCIAKSWAGMASGGINATTLLIVGYREADVLADVPDKVRVKKAYVLDVVDGFALVRQHGKNADLRGADLRGANLRAADLRSANLCGANLYGADLYDADLRGADLRDADLRGADLYGADLRDADLRGADLRGADLRGANLRAADLRGANLRSANLYGADLRGANANGYTVWPKGFVVPSGVTVLV